MKPKNTEVRAIAPKITQSAADWITGIFPTLNAGATALLDSFPTIYQRSLAEMRGKFSQGELCMILDVMNGCGAVLAFGSSGMAGQHVCLEVDDSFRLYPGQYEGKWNIADPKGFVDRMSALPLFARVCLELWSSGFWEKTYENTSPEEYCNILL